LTLSQLFALVVDVVRIRFPSVNFTKDVKKKKSRNFYIGTW